jgi:hypothetical protein
MYRELARRSQDGIVVRLLWDPVRDQIVVRYRDRRTGDLFANRVPNGQALEAFPAPERVPSSSGRGRVTGVSRPAA